MMNLVKRIFNRSRKRFDLGLSHSVVDGVTQLCHQYGRVIVLEDDLILHPSFVDFMLQSLDRYSEEDSVAQSAENGKIDSWAIRWYWFTFRQEKLTLYPRRSLVWQNGFDALTTHIHSASLSFQHPLDVFVQMYWPATFTFPQTVEVDNSAFDEVKKCLKSVTLQTFVSPWPRQLYKKNKPSDFQVSSPLTNRKRQII